MTKIVPEIRTNNGDVKKLAVHYLKNPDEVYTYRHGVYHIWNSYKGEKILRACIDGQYLNLDYSGRSIIVGPETRNRDLI